MKIEDGEWIIEFADENRDPSTRRVYESKWGLFERFCDKRVPSLAGPVVWATYPRTFKNLALILFKCASTFRQAELARVREEYVVFNTDEMEIFVPKAKAEQRTSVRCSRFEAGCRPPRSKRVQPFEQCPGQPELPPDG